MQRGIQMGMHAALHTKPRTARCGGGGGAPERAARLEARRDDAQGDEQPPADDFEPRVRLAPPVRAIVLGDARRARPPRAAGGPGDQGKIKVAPLRVKAEGAVGRARNDVVGGAGAVKGAVKGARELGDRHAVGSA